MAGNPFRRPGAAPPSLPGREGAAELSIDTSESKTDAYNAGTWIIY